MYLLHPGNFACLTLRPGLVGWRERPPRKKLRSIGDVVENTRHYDRRLPEIVLQQQRRDVQIRVMRACLVVDRVLDERERRNPYRYERHVVRAARVRDRRRGGTEVGERRQDLVEDRAHRLVGLRVDPANTARAIVDVEVGGELRMLLRVVRARPRPRSRVFEKGRAGPRTDAES